MSNATLKDAFDQFRPRIPSTVILPLETLLGTHKVEYAQARWADPQKQTGLEVDVFTGTHRFNAKLAEGVRPVGVSVTPLVFVEVRNDDDECSIVLRSGDTIRLFESSPTYFGDDGPARTATGRPEQFLHWAITHGTWV